MNKKLDLTKLNRYQRQAVTSPAQNLLVLAGAGSGKTKVLTFRAAWLIEEGKVPSDSILLLTFTNKAAGEMKQRVQELTEKIPFFAGTFHSFCAKILRSDGRIINIPINFSIYDDEDQKDVISDILVDLNLSSDEYRPQVISALISEAKSQMLTPLKYAEIAQGDFQEKVFKIYLNYEKALEKAGALDFDDLLLKTVKLFQEDTNTLNKYQNILKHTLVDEWQDTNKIQYLLTKLIVGKTGQITAVGDASQSIYSWRGADFRNINYLVRDFPQIKIINLEQNYRSTQNILAAANSVIVKNSSHPILKLWTQNTKGEKIKIYRARNGLDEATFIIEKILELQAAKKFGLKDIAILYRTNAQSRVLEEALLHSGIPYIIVGGIRFYSRTEIKDILALLRLLTNPKDKVSQKRIEKLGQEKSKICRVAESF